MARVVDFRKPRLGEYTAPYLSVSSRGFAPFRQQDVGQLRKGLDLYCKGCISAIKIRWKLRMVGFSYEKKIANLVMWKDKEFEYDRISSA